MLHLAPTAWGAADLMLSPLLFNNYMNLLGNFIHCQGLRYHQCADNTQLYIFAPGKLSDAMMPAGSESLDGEQQASDEPWQV